MQGAPSPEITDDQKRGKTIHKNIKGHGVLCNVPHDRPTRDCRDDDRKCGAQNQALVSWRIATCKKSPGNKKGEEAKDESVLRGDYSKDRRRSESSLDCSKQRGEASNYH